MLFMLDCVVYPPYKPPRMNYYTVDNIRRKH